MESTLAWMDYSRTERRRVMDAMALLAEQDSVDELGIGTVRDAFSNLLFPGISTIQTRARYFLFIPWIYRDLESRKPGSASTRALARKREIALIEGLIREGETEGVIGIEARKNLKRLPSEIYWQGLMRWGIRRYPGGREQYHRYLDRQRRIGMDDHSRHANWHHGLPSAPAGFPYRATLDVTIEEAEYLLDRVSQTCTGSLLWFLLINRCTHAPDYPWGHQLLAEMPRTICDQLMHARNLSVIMHGAMLLYNLYLARAMEDEKLVSEYRERFENWYAESMQLRSELMQWDLAEFWRIVLEQNSRVNHLTQTFVREWIDVVQKSMAGDHPAAALSDRGEIRELLAHRERQIKKNRARLSNPRARERWRGASGTARLSYRWPVVRTIVRDILRPLEDGTNA